MIQEKPINIFPLSEHSDPVRHGLGTQYAINSTSQGQLSDEDPLCPPCWVRRCRALGHKEELDEPKIVDRQAVKDTSLVSGSVELLDQAPPER